MQATLLVGSPKGPQSTSNSLGTYLIERLQELGVETEKAYLYQYVVSEEKMTALFELVDKAGLLILAFPLYIDSLHSAAIESLEQIALHSKTRNAPKQKRFVAIANCGFPEAKHNATALNVCRLFAKEAGYLWAGGLAVGGGGMIAGQPLAELGFIASNIRKALEITAHSLAQEEPVPQEAMDLAGKLNIPIWLYLLMANRGWRSEAKRNNVKNRMLDQPCRDTS